MSRHKCKQVPCDEQGSTKFYMLSKEEQSQIIVVCYFNLMPINKCNYCK